MIVNPKYTAEACALECEKTQFPGVCSALSGHRYYSPSLGRFINRDPIEEQGGINLYSFVGNNPVNAYDYLGMDAFGAYEGYTNADGTMSYRFVEMDGMTGEDFHNASVAKANSAQTAMAAGLAIAGDIFLKIAYDRAAKGDYTWIAMLDPWAVTRGIISDLDRFQELSPEVQEAVRLQIAWNQHSKEDRDMATKIIQAMNGSVAPNNAGYTALLGDGIGSDGSILGARGGEANALTPNVTMNGITLAPTVIAENGVLTLSAANDHYRNGGGVPVIVYAPFINFGGVNPSGFSASSGRQLYTFPKTSGNFYVYGTVTLQLNPGGGSFRVLNDTYDFDMHSWKQQPIRNLATLAGNVFANPSGSSSAQPFPIIFKGDVPLPTPTPGKKP